MELNVGDVIIQSYCGRTDICNRKFGPWSLFWFWLLFWIILIIIRQKSVLANRQYYILMMTN